MLAQKKKRKEKKHPSQNQMMHLNVSGSEALIAKLCTNYEGARGPRVKYKWALPKSGSIRVCVAQERLGEESDKEKEEKKRSARRRSRRHAPMR